MEGGKRTPWPVITFEFIYLEPSRNGIYKSKEFHGEGLKIINMGELFAYDTISNQDMNRIKLNESEILRFTLNNGDLLFGRRSLVESGAGKCSIVENLLEPTTFESSIIRVRINQIYNNPRFYYYWFRSPKGRAVIKAIVTGTNVKGITGNNLKKIVIDNPKIEIQNKLTSILSQYDNLIENNRRRIQLLEEAAHLLYQEWFVRLRFPGHEHTKIVDGLPEGWKYLEIQDIANVNQSSLKSNYQGAIEYVDISSVKSGIILETTQYEFIDAPSRARRIVQHGDVIWSCVRPNLKAYTIIWNPPENMIVSTGFAVITPRLVPSSYLYFSVTTNEFISYLSNNAKGTSYPAVRGVDFETAKILYPLSSVVQIFDNIVKPLINQISILNVQSKKLQQARDLLPPRLMNGVIPV
jgi:type I restriction enzyme, S subunit